MVHGFMQSLWHYGIEGRVRISSTPVSGFYRHCDGLSLASQNRNYLQPIPGKPRRNDGTDALPLPAASLRWSVDRKIKQGCNPDPARSKSKAGVSCPCGQMQDRSHPRLGCPLPFVRSGINSIFRLRCGLLLAAKTGLLAPPCLPCLRFGAKPR